MSHEQLAPFFRPRAVAVIGASRDPQAIGHRLLRSIQEGGYPGPIYPVNPRADTVAGLACYPSVGSIPGPVDLAVVAVPAAAVQAVAEECAARGVKALLVVSAGFAEAGPEGERMQRRLLDTVRAAGMRLIGPNCLGVVCTSPQAPLNATFACGLPPHGSVAMSSDSGGLGLALLTSAAQLGVSACVSVGNRADVSSNDLLEYWGEDDDTSIVLLYLESFGNPRRFARIARQVTKRKPVIAVKAGRTGAGRRAAGSHTAAVAASDRAADALFRQTGVLRVETLQEMFDLAAALSRQPPPRGRRVGIVTNAGGPAILCADACEAGGLLLPELSDATRAGLASFLPSASALGNPVDLIASATPEQFRRALALLGRSGEVDALVAIHFRADATRPEKFRDAIVAGAQEAALPVLACRMGQGGPPDFGAVPCYPFPEVPGRVLARMAEYAQWRARPAGTVPVLADVDPTGAREVCRRALARGPGWLNASEGRELLRAMGVALPPGGVARSPDEAMSLARSLGYPVALKLASHRVVHKTEAGGVHLGLRSENEVRHAFNLIAAVPGAEGEALVQPMLRGTEVLVGLTRDPLFGPLLAFGLGGVYVEVLGDVRLGIAPLTGLDAADMVRGIRGRALLDGYRGHPPADVPALEGLLLRLSRLAEEVPELAELDLNPVFALPPGQGYLVADVRVRVAPVGGQSR
jgi:acyl-CoA synthetase (NDP forming)